MRTLVAFDHDRRPGLSAPARRSATLIGQTLSHYRITSRLGAGGMGEVYRATDTTLRRDVAIKVLPEDVARNRLRLARFRREAQLLASLNHPHIAAIYGLEEAGGRPFLALELVEGEGLRDRLARGPIPVSEALEIAEQIAEALEEAHARGIIHRDLKPGNVRLTPDGKVKVLDFGLAKACAHEEPTDKPSDPSASQLPTLGDAGTMAGVILGTAAYMSPEQARGKVVDRRADVWSFGALLWEMLTGQLLFGGETVTDTIAAVVTREPDLEELPAETPPPVRQLLARCLRKDPRARLPDIGAARLELQDLLASRGATSKTPAAIDTEATPGARERGRGERWAWGLAVVSAALAVVLGTLHFTRPSVPPVPVYFSIDAPEGLSLAPLMPVAVSADGRQVAVAGSTPGHPSRLWLRPLDSPEARALPGTEGAYGPFWSPDGAFVGFFGEDGVYKVALASGTVQTICRLPLPDIAMGGTWSEEDTVLFSAGGISGQLFSVPATSGQPQPLTTRDEARGETGHWWPQFLPDGHRFLFVIGSPQEGTAGLYAASLDHPDRRRLVRRGPERAQFSPPHYLLFVRAGSLMGQTVDASDLTPTVGDPVAIVAPVATFSGNPAWGWFAASANGLLVYPQGGAAREDDLVWFDRAGRRLGSVGAPGEYAQIALSPDGRRVAAELTVSEEGAADIWTIDVARGVGSRLTFDAALDTNPVWSPDGRELAFSSSRDGPFRLMRKRLNGNEAESRLLIPAVDVYPECWSPDGKFIVYKSVSPDGQALWAVPAAGDGEPEPLVKNGFEVDEGQVSPDGRWLAYISRESGRWEVYLTPFRRGGERIRVSPNGGGQPKWRGDGKELFYGAPDGRLMAVKVSTGDEGAPVDLPTALFDAGLTDPIRDQYTLAADGQRFLVKVPRGKDAGARVHAVLNWPSLLK